MDGPRCVVTSGMQGAQTAMFTLFEIPVAVGFMSLLPLISI